MIEICEKNRFSNAYGADHEMFPVLGRLVRRFERAGIPCRLFFHADGPHKNKYAVYREGLITCRTVSKATPYGHRVDRRVG